MIWSIGSPEEVRAEAGDIVRGAALARPREMLAAELHDAFEQFLTFQAGTDFGSWDSSDNYAATTIQRFFPREFSQFKHSLQQQDKLETAVVDRVYDVALIFSLGGVVSLLVLTRFDVMLVEFILVIGVALAVNAFATGAFSEVADRYQARIIWLVPLAFVISFLVYRRQRDGSRSTVA